MSEEYTSLTPRTYSCQVSVRVYEKQGSTTNLVNCLPRSRKNSVQLQAQATLGAMSLSTFSN